MPNENGENGGEVIFFSVDETGYTAANGPFTNSVQQNRTADHAIAPVKQAYGHPSVADLTLIVIDKASTEATFFAATERSRRNGVSELRAATLVFQELTDGNGQFHCGENNRRCDR